MLDSGPDSPPVPAAASVLFGKGSRPFGVGSLRMDPGSHGGEAAPCWLLASRHPLPAAALAAMFEQPYSLLSSTPRRLYTR